MKKELTHREKRSRSGILRLEWKLIFAPVNRRPNLVLTDWRLAREDNTLLAPQNETPPTHKICINILRESWPGTKFTNTNTDSNKKKRRSKELPGESEMWQWRWDGIKEKTASDRTSTLGSVFCCECARGEVLSRTKVTRTMSSTKDRRARSFWFAFGV